MKLTTQALTLCFIFLLLFPTVVQSNEINLEKSSLLNQKQEFGSILVSTEDPYYSLISTPLACSYSNNEQILHPMVLIEDQLISTKQKDLLSDLSSYDPILSIGCNPINIDTTPLIGSAVELSHLIAKTYFSDSHKALILPYTNLSKRFSTCMIASPLASYLNIPIILYNDQDDPDLIQKTLDYLEVHTIFTLHDFDSSMIDDQYEIHIFHNDSEIQQYILEIIKDEFNSINYITITNPADIEKQHIIKKTVTYQNQSVNHHSIFLFGKKLIVSGRDTVIKKVLIPEGIHELSLEISMKNITSIFSSEDTPIFLSATLVDPKGKTVAYAHSPGYEKNQTYLETLITNLSGEYTLSITLFHGYRGGYFSLRGISNVNTDLSIKETLCTLSSVHYPLVSGLSLNAAYLTSAHGGIIIADTDFNVFDEEFGSIADQHGSGPWYDEGLHEYNNRKVEYVLQSIKNNLSLLETNNLLENYLNGPAWLAILGDTNMLPMYYYQSNQTHLAERGLPSDNPYSLNENLSVGRILSYTTSDASALITRTLFYDQLCGMPDEKNNWHNRFNFVFGEGFGETGGIFHQIPYAKNIESYGFETTVYGDLRNSRQAAERNQVYTDTNYVEYLGHGDWYWFTPSIYGFNSVGQSIGSYHIRSWEIKKPNVVLSSACLMGRVDGVVPYMNVGLSFLYSGSNAFIGATRETGQEAGLETLENHLIIDDYSLGEALRGEKQVDKEKPTYYVRCLFGDPAFNPFDPLHGFSDQGTPYN